MAEAVALPQDMIKLPDMPEVGLVEASTTLGEPDVVNDDVMIDEAPDRPCGTIRVKLVYAGRSTPIPADDPWTE
jgi:hypothetical protein